MEEIAKANGDGARFFQLYWGKSDAIAESFVKRAEACGCKAIFITLDTTILGWRPRDLDLGFLPFLRGAGHRPIHLRPRVSRDAAADAGRKPARARRCNSRRFSPIPGSIGRASPKSDRGRNCPIVLKGIMRADDAAKAVSEGYDGIMVSNHGGRQVDGGIGALDALPGVVAAVQGQNPGAVRQRHSLRRRIFKALALGATAVGIGRPYVYGLALGGEAGVQAVMEYLLAELDLTMALNGCREPCRHHLTIYWRLTQIT